MKTTIEIPDALFREAKASAARRGIAFKELVAEALGEKLAGRDLPARDRPWMRHFGALSHLSRAEHARINDRIEETFERIDPEKWR